MFCAGKPDPSVDVGGFREGKTSSFNSNDADYNVRKNTPYIIESDYATAIHIYFLISLLNYREGKEFLEYAAINNYDTDQMREYLFQFEMKYPEVRKALVEGGTTKTYYDSFYLFKRNVTSNKMCEAVNILFKDFKGKEEYNKAISFLINSPNVDRNKKYKCGDKSLEMLLN